MLCNYVREIQFTNIYKKLYVLWAIKRAMIGEVLKMPFPVEHSDLLV